MKARTGAALAAFVLAGCALLPTSATPPTAGLWQFTYELGAADSAAIGSRLARRLRLNKPGIYKEDGALLGVLFTPNEGTKFSISDLLNGLCPKGETCTGDANYLLKVTGPGSMEGTVTYRDVERSLKIGPAKVTAALVDMSTPPPTAAPSP